MKFLISKVCQKSSNIHLTIIFQLIICYLRVCKCNQFYDSLKVSQDFGPDRYVSDSLFKFNTNFSTAGEPRLNKELVRGLPITPGMVQFASKKPHTLPKVVSSRRSKRRINGINGKPMTEMVQDVCPSVSDWVARPEALDPYGNRLQVVQRIPINGTVINQYFYETFCANNLDYYGYDYSGAPHQSGQCKGIDKKIWHSRCRENYIWTYGKVVTNNGDIGWSVIAIRGSCGCAIWPKAGDVTTGRGRRLSPQRVNKEDNHLLADPFF